MIDSPLFSHHDGSWDFGLLVFGLLVFGLLVFGLLVFGLLVFGLLVFGLLVFGLLVFGLLVFGLLIFGLLVFGSSCPLSFLKVNKKMCSSARLCALSSRYIRYSTHRSFPATWITAMANGSLPSKWEKYLDSNKEEVRFPLLENMGLWRAR